MMPNDETRGEPTPPPSSATAGDDDAAGSPEFEQALEMFERSRGAASRPLVEATVGAKVHGKLVTIGDEQSMVDFGGRCEASVETRFLKDDAGVLTRAVGDELDLFVIGAADQIVLAPALRAEPNAALGQFRESKLAGVPVSGKVASINAGGLEVDLGSMRGFCPFSQIEAGFCADPSVYLGRTLEFLITEMEEGRGNVVLSRKALLKREEQEKGKKLLETLKVGDEFDGRVVRLEAFGAFVDLGGVDGLVHVSEIRHERLGHPKEALKEGEKVRVRVLKLEPGKGGRPKISLSIKAVAPDPWADVERQFPKGTRVRGTVARLTDFGAFVNVAPGIDGLVHVSEAATRTVTHVRQVLQPKQEVEAIVLAVDAAKKRISLSIKEALAATGEESPASAEPSTPAAPKREVVIGDKLEGFVANVKPYGVFVNLPAYGHRASGMVPHEETGEKRGADLAQKFPVGSALEVEVIGMKEGKIRLGIVGMERAERPAPPARSEVQARPEPRGDRSADGAERSSRPPARGDRPARSARPARSDRPDRFDRGDRDRDRDREPVRVEVRDEGPTTMAIALRKAMEQARERERRASEKA